jgi:hypothetical protein
MKLSYFTPEILIIFLFKCTRELKAGKRRIYGDLVNNSNPTPWSSPQMRTWARVMHEVE